MNSGMNHKACLVHRVSRRFNDFPVNVNLDQIVDPDLGYFVEVKARTWSKGDAEEKARLMGEMLLRLGASPEDGPIEDYSELS